MGEALGLSKQCNIILYCLVLKDISQEFDSFLAMTFQEVFKCRKLILSESNFSQKKKKKKKQDVKACMTLTADKCTEEQKEIAVF